MTLPPEHPSRIHLSPGDHYVSGGATIISTLLGSCIAACLYDPAGGIVGMNHFLLAVKRNPNGNPIHLTEAGKYGIHAMELVINGMLKLGAQRKNLRAKAFGGGSVIGSGTRDGFLNVAETNCRFILDFLRNEGIPLVAYDLGGNSGRVIRFHSEDFRVDVRRFRISSGERVLQEEKRYWLKEMTREKRAHGDVDLWG